MGCIKKETQVWSSISSRIFQWWLWNLYHCKVQLITSLMIPLSAHQYHASLNPIVLKSCECSLSCSLRCIIQRCLNGNPTLIINERESEPLTILQDIFKTMGFSDTWYWWAERGIIKMVMSCTLQWYKFHNHYWNIFQIINDQTWVSFIRYTRYYLIQNLDGDVSWCVMKKWSYLCDSWTISHKISSICRKWMVVYGRIVIINIIL